MIQTTDPRQTHLTTAQMKARISFHTDEEILEIDLSSVHFETQKDINRFYDLLEDCIDETGEQFWFFMVNYSDCRIDPDAWFAHARRGKALNLAHSQGSVRFDMSEENRAQIEKEAGTEAFDPNLFADRNNARARLLSMPSKRTQKIEHKPNHTADDLARRLRFQADAEILEIDLSDFTLFHSRDVDDLYDQIEDQIRPTGRKWFFLINYNGCQIMPEAWVQFARRGKSLNLGASLGTVRFAAGSETEKDIRMRAQTQDFRPNIRNTRAEALSRIEEMKAGQD